MLKKALTAGATVILAILASAGVAEASEVNTSQILPLPPIAAPADPEPTTVPEPEDDSESTSDDESTSVPESDSQSDSESDTPSDSDSDSSTDSESDSESSTDPESDEELETVEPAPAPVEEEPAAGPLGLIESLVTSLFG